MSFWSMAHQWYPIKGRALGMGRSRECKLSFTNTKHTENSLGLILSQYRINHLIFYIYENHNHVKRTLTIHEDSPRV